MSPGPSTPARESFWQRTDVILGGVGGILAVISSILAAVWFFNPIPERDVTVWIQQQVQVALPPGTPLNMTYDSSPVRRAALLQVRLTNFGPKAVGDTQTWQLTLKSPGASRIALVSAPQLSPPNLTLKPFADSSGGGDSLSFELGLLRTGETADLRLLIVDPVSIEHPALAAESTRAANIPTPRITRVSPHELVRAHYENPLVLIFWVVFSVAFLVWAIRSKVFRVAKDYVFLPIMMIFMAGFGAAGLAKAASWLLVRLVLFRVYHPNA